MIKHYRIRDYDFKLIFFVVALTIIGIMAIGSAKESVQTRQIAGFVFGLFLMFVLSLFDYSVILRFYWLLYIANIVLLILVSEMGETKNNAQRWLNIFGIQFQPSETAKILLILFFAQLIMRHQDKMGKLKFIMACTAMFAVPLWLIYDQPDLSTSIMVVILFCVCYNVCRRPALEIYYNGACDCDSGFYYFTQHCAAAGPGTGKALSAAKNSGLD